MDLANAVAEFDRRFKEDAAIRLHPVFISGRRVQCVWPTPKRRQRRWNPVAPDGRQVPYAGGLHLYLLESERGVKFGVSTQPFHRLRTHSSDASKFGVQLYRCWVSDHAGDEAREVESYLKRDNRGAEFIEASFDHMRTKVEILIGPGTTYKNGGNYEELSG